MRYETLSVDLRDEIAWVRMNRPESMNALEYQLRLDLLDCFNNHLDSDQSKVVILTGSGKAFCAGGDLRELKKGLSVDHARKLALHCNKIILAIRNLRKPVIAAVNGVAFGAGFSIAMACDLIIATQKAEFSQVFIKVGLVPDLGATYFTPRLVGLHKSKELALTAKIIGADDLEKLGVINYVVPHEDLEKQAFDLACRIAEGPAAALGLTKKLLNQSWNFSLEDMLELEAQTQTGCMQSEDHKAGLAAFYQKRKNKFKGK